METHTPLAITEPTMPDKGAEAGAKVAEITIEVTAGATDVAFTKFSYSGQINAPLAEAAFTDPGGRASLSRAGASDMSPPMR